MNRKPLTPAQIEYLQDLARRLDEATHGQKRTLFRAAEHFLCCGHNKIRAMLRQVGWAPARKQRTDAGVTKISERDLLKISAYLFGTLDQKGRYQPIDTALRILSANREIATEAHRTTVERQLRAKNLHPKQLAQPSRSKHLTALHPNHVVEVDSTTASLYHDPDGQSTLFFDDAVHNRNKIEHLVAVKPRLLTLWSWTDKVSGATKHMLLKGGESHESAIKFCVWAMLLQPGNPVHGVPFILMTDQGPAYKSKPFKQLMDGLDIKHVKHAPRNARATGSVENSHLQVQRHLETRFKLLGKAELDLQSMQEALDLWTIDRGNSHQLQRHGLTLFDAWNRIKPEQLRVPTSREALMDMANGIESRCRVDQALCIEFKGKSYMLDSVPGVEVGDRVTVRRNAFRAEVVGVLPQHVPGQPDQWYEVAPRRLNEWGYDGEHVIGEQIKGLPESQRDRNRKLVQRELYRDGVLPTLEEAEKLRRTWAKPFGGTIDPFADIRSKSQPVHLPRRSTEHAFESPRIAVRRLSRVAALTALVQRMGAAYTPQVREHVMEHWPDGVPEDQLDAIAALFMPAATTTTRTPTHPHDDTSQDASALPLPTPACTLPAFDRRVGFERPLHSPAQACMQLKSRLRHLPPGTYERAQQLAEASAQTGLTDHQIAQLGDDIEAELLAQQALRAGGAA